MSNTGYFPLHAQQQAVGSPPEVPLLLKQSQDRLKALAVWRKGLIDGVDIATTSVNNALAKLQPNSSEFVKLAKYMQRCHEHRDRLLQVMDLLGVEETVDQKFLGYWLEQKELPGFSLPPITQQSSQVQQQVQQAIDSRLPLGPDGKPIGVVRSDGVVDITAKSTSLPMNGQLTPEQAAELGVLGPAGPAGVVPPINVGGVLSKEQQAAYIKAEEERVKVPAKNIAGIAPVVAGVAGTVPQQVVSGIPVVSGPPANGQGQVG
jgi:hypothetical protein